MNDLDDKLREILRALAMEVAEIQKRGAERYDWRGKDINEAIAQIKQLFKEHGWEEQDGDS